MTNAELSEMENKQTVKTNISWSSENVNGVYFIEDLCVSLAWVCVWCNFQEFNYI